MSWINGGINDGTKKRYDSNWYNNRKFIVVEISDLEDVELFENLIHKKGIHYDYRGISENGNNIFIIF